ncbi:MAG: AarF/UbiB family protein [Actinobacteria bacterium]|nr:AarF/UbiB family protein [Actinomycetota bacterium]
MARPLRLIFQDLGATFMKFGQLIASSPGMFGDAMANEFRSCLDTGPVVDFDQVRDQVERNLGMPLVDAFESFERHPIGCASIAVVHRARLKDGREVAVKVLRPGIDRTVATDLDLLQPLLEVVARQTGNQVAASLLQLVDGFREQIGEELDLRNEARAMLHYRRLLEEVDLAFITVPEPYPELSGPQVLTMEYLDGVAVDDLEGLARMELDPRPLVEGVVRGFFLTAIRWGVFHGDVHAGNLLVLRDGRMGILDWGIVGRLDPETHLFFCRIIEAALGNEAAWEDIAEHLSRAYGPALKEGLGLDGPELAQFIRSMMEPILTRPFGEISLGAIMQAPMDQITRSHGIRKESRSLISIARRFRQQRRLRGMIESHGTVGSTFDRGTFLLSKQLIYFERYGKMFLSDVSLLSDPEFFASLLQQTPVNTLSPAIQAPRSISPVVSDKLPEKASLPVPKKIIAP